MAVQALVDERLLNLSITTFSASDPDMQRGRKRRRGPPDVLEAAAAAQIASGESGFRGRCRHRSTSRVDSSRTTSRLRGGSLSPTRRKLLRIIQLNTHHRSQSPSRSRSPTTQDPPKRRRQRTRSRSRLHEGTAKNAGDPASSLRHELLRQDIASDVEDSPHGPDSLTVAYVEPE
jgi:hypothetical protein